MAFDFEFLLKVILVVILGGVIGYEREIRHRPAGFRTHILVALGAMLITVVSTQFFQNADPSRIAAGIITGIGFLGAGAIIGARERIIGLTTAATLWVVAAVGLAIGASLYVEAIIVAVLVFIVLEMSSIFGIKTKG
ncbi:MAG: MgtC/SapB family protein [Nanoarchaeota archaeon]